MRHLNPITDKVINSNSFNTKRGIKKKKLKKIILTSHTCMSCAKE